MLKFRNSDNRAEVAVTVSTETFVRLALLTLVIIVLTFMVRKAAYPLTLIFIAFFLALALNGPVYWLSRQLPGKSRGSRSIATTISFLTVVIVLGLFIASIVPPLVKQTESLVNQAPTLIKDFRSQSGAVGGFIRHYHLQKEVGSISNQLSGRIKNVGGTAFNTARSIGSSFFAVLTVLVLTFMMLVEGPHWIRFIREIVPDRHHNMVDKVGNDMYRVIRGYVNGQVILAALAAALIMPAVLLLHISYPAAIVVIIFICGLIPLVGHTIGAVIVTTIALFHSTGSAIAVLLYYIFYMQIEAYIVQPRIQANTTNMSPLLVFMSVVVGISFGGLVGGLVAIPIAGCLRIALLEYFYSNKIIDEPKFDKTTKAGTK